MPIAYALLHETPSAEDRAALDVLPATARTVPLHTTLDPRHLAGIDVLWIHAVDRAAWTAWNASDETLQAVRAYVEQGGGLVCTNFAAHLPHRLGLEPLAPDVRATDLKDKGFGRGYGFQSFRGHPLLAGGFGGLILWYPDTDRSEERTGYFDDAWPEAGRVVGVEKAYITLAQRTRLLIEHEVGRGRIVSAGAFIHLAEFNHRATHLHDFLRRTLAYAAGPTDRPETATYWAPDAGLPVPFEVESAPLEPNPQRSWTPEYASDLMLQREATSNVFDVVGRRCMMLGRETGGLEEIWVHPFRIVQDLEAGLLDGSGVRWLHTMPCRFEMHPEAAVRTYRLDRGTLTERLIAPLDGPGALLVFQADGTAPLRLVIRFRTDFRWMWPYEPDTLGRLRFGYDTGLQALHVCDRSGDFYALYGGDLSPDRQFGGPYARIEVKNDAFEGVPPERPHVAQAFAYTLDASNGFRLHFAVAGSDQGRPEAERTWRRLLTHPARVVQEAARHTATLLESRTMLTTPDPIFNTGYGWALIGTDRFWARTPALGLGLLAGYGTAASGWDGGQAVSGRPGYAWYFGRDAQWACFAVNGYGDFASVRAQLELFARFQDLTGKIFHELPSSGVVHYDAADATPLYLILAAHYLRASGDVACIRTLWPSLQQALAFLYTTDTDGDGYIENTHVGHGWIEGGALYGAHTTLYLAGLWAQTLRDAAYLAETLGDPDDAERHAREAEAVIDQLEQDFWNEETAFYHYGKRRDGSFNPEQTILPAVLLHFRLLRPDRARPVLRTYAGNAFSTDWGARILSAHSALFNPKGYHYGSVWPLFTGWTALAEYAYGRSVQGFTHVLNNLRIYRHWSLGFIEEVLNGMQYQPAGVCAHQCWSETNVLHPIYAGLLGVQPDAPDRRLRFEPSLPIHWDALRVDNLWIGASRLHVAFERTAGRTAYTLTLADGPALTIDFAPQVPAGTVIRQVQVGDTIHPGDTMPPLVENGLSRIPLSFTLDGQLDVVFEHTGGIGVLPLVADPEPGDASRGYRIIDAELEYPAYRVSVEGPPGTTGRFSVRLLDGRPARLDGAHLVALHSNGVADLDVTFIEDEGPFRQQSFTVYLE